MRTSKKMLYNGCGGGPQVDEHLRLVSEDPKLTRLEDDDDDDDDDYDNDDNGELTYQRIEGRKCCVYNQNLFTVNKKRVSSLTKMLSTSYTQNFDCSKVIYPIQLINCFVVLRLIIMIS
jgi:hypothetical protein